MPEYTLSQAERAVYRRFASLALPRHTSYPTVPVWQESYGPSEFRADLGRLAERGRPLSLYVHIPFCERLCYYCACTKEIVPPERRAAHDPGEAFLRGLEAEADRLAELAGHGCALGAGIPTPPPGSVEQIHLGGGSPTFLRADQLTRLWQILDDRFAITPEAEIAIEIDPRITTREQLEILRSLGFYRVSLGVQDFAPAVQRAVNRLQSLEMVERTVGWCRALGFDSINFDLIYGLPFQTLESMADTLDKTLGLAPDRVAFYRLAVIPEIFRWQKVFRPADLPGADLCLDLNLLAINRFVAAGYEFIGLDHFARAEEALAQARRSGTLRRTFQGMTTGKELDILGLGPSAISQLDDCYAQNLKTVTGWEQAVAGNLATERGLRLSADDRLRRELMQQLYGHGIIDKRDLEARFGIDFDAYFTDERCRLRELIDLGLVQPESNTIEVTAPLGRLLVRVVAAIFDRYLPANAFQDGLAAYQASKVG
jgi:oxygen-independent coproporphyrinogen-3 oxidase